MEWVRAINTENSWIKVETYENTANTYETYENTANTYETYENTANTYETFEAVEPETNQYETNIIIVNKCGSCPGCLRRSCNECSFCKNGQKSQCIDKYCMNTDEGRRQREEAKAKYLASLNSAKADLSNLDFTPDRNLTVQEQVDMIMSQLQLKQKKRKADPTGPKKIAARVMPKSPKKPKTEVAQTEVQIGEVQMGEVQMGEVTPEAGLKKERAKHQMSAVYGSSAKAGKTRRCGECEGCMRDDCGQCAACADKPRFGGRGSKKKACIARSCRMRGPPSQGQAVAVKLQEGQTYQIMGYLDGDKAVVKPVEATTASEAGNSI